MKLIFRILLISFFAISQSNCLFFKRSPYKVRKSKAAIFEQVNDSTRIYQFTENIIETSSFSSLARFYLDDGFYFQLRETHYRGYTYPSIEKNGVEMILETGRCYSPRIGKIEVKKISSSKYSIKSYRRNPRQNVYMIQTIYLNDISNTRFDCQLKREETQ